METAQEALETGQIRHIGITSHSMEIAMEAAPSGHFETIQFPFNFVTHEPAAKLVPLAQAHNLGFIAMKPFAGGMLDDATLAIKYLLQFEGVVPDPGIESTEEIEEIASIIAGPLELTPDERQEMERICAEVSPHFCRRCGYCEPCPQGVRISLVINLRSFWKRYAPAHFRRGWLAAGVQSGRNCIECGECEEKCPYHLPIREMLAENLAFFDSAFS
jgi:predicted aldo/keto reductase-like oxidoreductase